MRERIMMCRSCGWHGPEGEVKEVTYEMDIGCVETFTICPQCGANENFEPWCPGLEKDLTVLHLTAYDPKGYRMWGPLEWREE